jgi:beta-lactamase class A
VERNPDEPLYCASAFKAFVLAEYLRQVEAGTATLSELLPVGESIWCPSSPVFISELPAGGVTGLVQARVALDAMIAYSDNTGTDMALKRVGADDVRAFIASIGLQQSRLPDSMRQLIGYLAGAPDWQTLTWLELLEVLENQPPTGPPLINDVETMVSTANDFVSFYSRALQGGFFGQESSLNTFRHLLTLADGSEFLPLGVTGFRKGGNFDFRQEHVLALAGGLFIPQRRWVYYSFLSNWVDGEGGTSVEEQATLFRVLRNIFGWLFDEFAT